MTRDLVAAWFPRFLTPVVRYSIYAMLDDMIKSFVFPKPLPFTRPLLRGASKSSCRKEALAFVSVGGQRCPVCAGVEQLWCI